MAEELTLQVYIGGMGGDRGEDKLLYLCQRQDNAKTPVVIST